MFACKYLNRRDGIQAAGAWGTTLWHYPRRRLPGFAHHVAAVGSHGKDRLRQLLGHTPEKKINK